jgi:pyridoxine/pyridoxamine 5'-phosphate oxidase
MMLQVPAIIPEIEQRDVLQYFENPTLQSVGNALVGHRFQSIDKIAELLNHVDDPKQRQAIAHLALVDESWDEKGCLRLISKFVEFNQRLHDRRRIEEKIKAAEKNKDHKLLFKLLSEKQRLAIRTEKRKMDLLNEKKREVRNE